MNQKTKNKRQKPEKQRKEHSHINKAFILVNTLLRSNKMPIENNSDGVSTRQKKFAAKKWGAKNALTAQAQDARLDPAKPNFAYEKDILSNITSFRLTPAVTKTLKFRAVTLLTTLGITWVVTGSPVASLSVTAIQQSTNTMVYYFFEQNEKSKKENKNKPKGFSASS